jgi:hypothetical protein
MRQEEALNRVNGDRNIVHTTKKRNADSIGHILRGNCLQKHAIERKTKGRIEVTGRRGRRQAATG